MASIANRFSRESHTTSATEQKVESKLNVKDLETLQEAFSFPGEGYDGKLSLSKEQFVEALGFILNRGTRQEYNDLFDKIDITGDGFVDWDKIASHLMLEFYEKDDRVKKLSVPQWKELKTLNSPHKDTIQRIIFMKHMSRYITVSKEGLIALWGHDLKLQGTGKAYTDACRQRDLCVTDIAVMSNINKIAIAFTSKEIAFCNISNKLDLACPTKLADLLETPLCLDHWHNPENPNESVLAWGDVTGYLNAIFWSQATIILFQKPTASATEKEEKTHTVSLSELTEKKCKTATYLRVKVHSDWVRQVKYIPQLEAFMTCATVWNNSLVLSWLEKLPSNNTTNRTPNQPPESRIISRSSIFNVHQGINGFDYHDGQNLIATAGVNYHVCLWNPYVVSKPNGLLRGHMASVVAVQFQRARGRLLSLSRDRVLRIWDIQLQICLQRIAGVFAKGLDDDSGNSRRLVSTRVLFHEDNLRLFVTFNQSLTMLEMKVKVQDRVFSHEKPVVGILFNSTFNQIVSASQDGTISFWLVDTGQRVKNISRSHKDAELTCLVPDPGGSRFYTGSTDGTIKIWDMNGHCHHTLVCFGGSHIEVGQVVILKRAVIVMGSSNHFTVFRTTNFRDHYVYPSEWKGAPEHCDDVLTGVALPPNALITASYDGEIIVWNTNSELAARKMSQRCKRLYEDNPEFLFNVSRLALLTNRKHIGPGSKEGANLVSCGGNGIVRFWNAYSCALIGEFRAHAKASNIIMTTDPSCEFLATGDTAGAVKIWCIKEYCLTEGPEEVINPPELLSDWVAHVDLISGLVFCPRYERRMFLITSSTDCAVALWTMEGVKLGVFGQELRWKLEHVTRDLANLSVASTETTQVPEHPEPDDSKRDSREQRTSSESTTSSALTFTVDNMAPLPEDVGLSELCNLMANYRVNAWRHTLLGKEYQEVRMRKRQRKQPRNVCDQPMLPADSQNKTNYGPYYYLQLSSFEPFEEMEQPDFMEHPEDYFLDKDDFMSVNAGEAALGIPAQSDSGREHHNVHDFQGQSAFDEGALLPNYVLRFDRQMKRTNQYINRNSNSNSVGITSVFEANKLGIGLSNPSNVAVNSNTNSSMRSSTLTGCSTTKHSRDRNKFAPIATKKKQIRDGTKTTAENNFL